LFVAATFDGLREAVPDWRVDIGVPAALGWIPGSALRAATGPLDELLTAIGERARTKDRKTIAASFALRFGWASILAIAPYLRCRFVPDIALDNVSFKFKESTFLERIALHELRGTMIGGTMIGGVSAASSTIRIVANDAELLHTLRDALVSQASPVVDALHDWSGFARRGVWGMLTSSWAAQFTSLCETPRDHRTVQPLIEGLFAGDDIVAAMRPQMHIVRLLDATHLYQRRASCCRYYLLPQGELCASCPLVSHDERMARNREWMQTMLERVTRGPGH
jgi:hypothetical protein